MDEISLSVTTDDRADDLPRALRSGGVRAEAAVSSEKVVVTGIEIGFWRLTWLLVKLALAAVPALVLLAAALFAASEVLAYLFPTLVKLKILIYVP